MKRARYQPKHARPDGAFALPSSPQRGRAPLDPPDAPSEAQVASVERESAPDAEESTARSVLRSTGLMTIATLASRATGLIRTWAMAFALGNTLLTSSYQIANNLPNVIFDLVAGGLLSAAFLPVLLLERQRAGQDGFNRYGSNILNLTLIVLGLLALLSGFFSEYVVATQTFTVSAGSEVVSTAVDFYRIFALQIVFYGLSGVVTGILNARRSFFLASVAPALNNVVVIAAFFGYALVAPHDPALATWILGIGTTAGVAVQFAVQIPALGKAGFRWRPVLDVRDPAIRETIRIAVPTLLYIVANLIAFSCRNAFSLQAEGNGPSTLSYAWIWFQLPYGVIAVSLSSAFFTEMSDAAAKEDWAAFRQHVVSGIRGTLFVIIPLSVLVFALADTLMGIFHAGAFTGEAVREVSSILRIWIIGLPVYSVLMYLYKAFASLRRFMSFALINCALVVLQVGLYALLGKPEILGVAGIPAADALYYAVGCVASLALLRRSVPGLRFWPLLALGVQMLVPSALGGLAAWGFTLITPLHGGVAFAFANTLIAGLIGLAVIFPLAALMRVPETALLRRIAGRFLRR